jgi:hypothetical protein
MEWPQLRLALSLLLKIAEFGVEYARVRLRRLTTCPLGLKTLLNPTS